MTVLMPDKSHVVASLGLAIRLQRITMSKTQDKKKSDKNKPAKTVKEKKLAKKAKKENAGTPKL